MTAPRVGAYARAVEEALNRARGRPAVLSPRDWARVADWSARGVPLSVVLEALEEVAARHRHRGGALRSLALVAPAVEETWRTVAEGRPVPGSAGPAPTTAAARWRAAREGRPPEDALARWLARAEVRLQEGDAPATLEDELDLQLHGFATEEQRAQAGAEVDRALVRFQGRMADDAFAATRRRALSDALRRALRLPPRAAW